MTDDIEHDIHVVMPPKRVEAVTCGKCERLATENARLRRTISRLIDVIESKTMHQLDRDTIVGAAREAGKEVTR